MTRTESKAGAAIVKGLIAASAEGKTLETAIDALTEEGARVALASAITVIVKTVEALDRESANEGDPPPGALS